MTDTNITIREAREKIGMSRAQMNRTFQIPLRTLEDWEAGTRKPPVWAKKLILEKLEQIKKENEKTDRLTAYETHLRSVEDVLIERTDAVFMENRSNIAEHLFDSVEKIIDDNKNRRFMRLVEEPLDLSETTLADLLRTHISPFYSHQFHSTVQSFVMEDIEEGEAYDVAFNIIRAEIESAFPNDYITEDVIIDLVADYYQSLDVISQSLYGELMSADPEELFDKLGIEDILLSEITTEQD